MIQAIVNMILDAIADLFIQIGGWVMVRFMRLPKNPKKWSEL